MNILVIGNGGREHAIGWSLKKASADNKLFFMPGNAGTSGLGESVEIGMTDIASIRSWVDEKRPDLCLVGPEAPLCAGVVDALEEARIKVFGPRQNAAMLEGSKVFAKELFISAGIPTAASKTFSESSDAIEYLKKVAYPTVIKAEGLAAGKGVVIAEDFEMACRTAREMLDGRVFGDAGQRIVIEEFLRGEEVSVHAITDGVTLKFLPSSQDHKRIFDGDVGSNTGGMGAYAPAPILMPNKIPAIEKLVFRPLLDELKRRGVCYKGVLYGGLMMTTEGPKVLEFNCRFGDPETQVLLPLLKTSLIDIALAVVDTRLDEIDFEVEESSAMAVVAAARGYPAKPQTGMEVVGWQADSPRKDSMVFCAGMKGDSARAEVSGGRVLASVGVGDNLQDAKNKAYARLEKIHFEGMQFRKDIGHRALG